MRILCVVIAMWAVSAVHAFETKTVGGPGGQKFELECPDSRSLAGLFLRFDDTIAQMDAVCVATTNGAWRDQPRRVLSNSQNKAGGDDCGPLGCKFGEGGNAIGGDEGHTSTTLMCPPDSLVYALNVATAPVATRQGEIEVVGRVDIHCVNPRTGREDIVTPIPRPEGAREYVDRWPADCRSQSGKFWATGLTGRAGYRIDALGLRCVSPSAPDRPLRKEAVESAPVLSPIKPSKNLDDARIGAGTRLTPSPPSPPPSPPPAAPPPAGPKSQIFYRPQTAGYERLHACLYLPKTGCGRPAAVEFCKTKSFALAASFEVEKGRFRSETVFGEFCRSGKCRVFTEIECAN